MKYTDYKKIKNTKLERKLFTFDDGFKGYFKYNADLQYVEDYANGQEYIVLYYGEPIFVNIDKIKIKNYGLNNIVWEYLPIEQVLNDPYFDFVVVDEIGQNVDRLKD